MPLSEWALIDAGGKRALTLTPQRGTGGIPAMTKTLLSLVTVAALCGLAVQAQDKPKTEDKPVSNSTADEVAVINTSEGTMVLEFWPDVAPKHVENFKKLANSG